MVAVVATTTITLAAVTVIPTAAVATPSVPATPDVAATTVETDSDEFLTSDPFTTAAGNELLVALFSADGPGDAYDEATTYMIDPPERDAQSVVSVTGCGLTWSLAGQAHGMPGVAAVYTAQATSVVTDCAVEGELEYGSDGMVTVLTFTGAAATLGDVRQYSTAYSAGFGATFINVDGSLVYQVGHNWSNALEPIYVGASDTSAPPQDVPASVIATYLSDVGDTSYVSHIDGPLNATPTGTDRYADLATFFSFDNDQQWINSVTFVVQPA
jgi:hypothetical protein